MSELLLINPRKRTRSAAQKAATRRMVAANRSRKSPTRKRSTKTVIVQAARRTRRAAHSAARHIRRRLRSKGARASMGSIGHMVKGGLIGGAGAVLVDVLASKLPIPATMQTGVAGAATRVALAIGAGMLLGKVMNKATAHQLAAGSITVTGYNLIKSLVGPMIGLSAVTDINGVGFYSPAVAPVAYGSDNISGADSMGAYLSGAGSDRFDYDTSMSPADNMYAY